MAAKEDCDRLSGRRNACRIHLGCSNGNPEDETVMGCSRRRLADVRHHCDQRHVGRSAVCSRDLVRAGPQHGRPGLRHDRQSDRAPGFPVDDVHGDHACRGHPQSAGRQPAALEVKRRVRFPGSNPYRHTTVSVSVVFQRWGPDRNTCSSRPCCTRCARTSSRSTGRGWRVPIFGSLSAPSRC